MILYCRKHDEYQGYEDEKPMDTHSQKSPHKPSLPHKSKKIKKTKIKKRLNSMLRRAVQDYHKTKRSDFDNTDEYENELSYKQGRIDILHELKAQFKGCLQESQLRDRTYRGMRYERNSICM